MTVITEIESSVDPRHVFLSAREVMQRYRWSKTKGYQNLKDRDLVPPPVVTGPSRWRLDQLLAWEERGFTTTEKVAEDVKSDPDLDAQQQLAAALPQPKIRRARKKRAKPT